MGEEIAELLQVKIVSALDILDYQVERANRDDILHFEENEKLELTRWEVLVDIAKWRGRKFIKVND